MTQRRDCLRECNEFGVPVEDFQQQFCARCVQPECTRSQHGKSLFEQRVATWEDRLFLNVPTMSPTDPQYATLRAKNFFDIDPGPVPEVRGGNWIDPRDLVKKDQPAEVAPEVKPKAPEPAASPGSDTKPDVAGTPTPEPPKPFMNTGFQQGKMIGPTPAPKPITRDPWAAESTPISGPGVKIRFGKDG